MVVVSIEVIVVLAGIPVPDTGIAGANPAVVSEPENVTVLDALAYAAVAKVLRTYVVLFGEVIVPVKVALFLSPPVRFVRVKPMLVSIKLRLPSAFPEFSTAVNSISSSAASCGAEPVKVIVGITALPDSP